MEDRSSDVRSVLLSPSPFLFLDFPVRSTLPGNSFQGVFRTGRRKRILVNRPRPSAPVVFDVPSDPLTYKHERSEILSSRVPSSVTHVDQVSQTVQSIRFLRSYRGYVCPKIYLQTTSNKTPYFVDLLHTLRYTRCGGISDIMEGWDMV